MKTKLGLQIAVLDRGFVYVGDVSIDGELVRITSARNVRVWGTENGLGQLALEGPQKATKLDPAGVVTAPMRAVIHFIECAKTWK